MRARKARPIRANAGIAGNRQLRDEFEAEVFEIWVGVSRLMSRLHEPHASLKNRRGTARRRRTAGSGSQAI